MRGTVSMVMPCYNKANYIREMFDSILAQDWDNIQLILVNDGSTDGTREIISAYEPQFHTRGFDVVIIDQENAGVCAAAKAGLAQATGDYICMVDSDDELDPTYVSTLAGWLDEHPDYDLAVCEGVEYTGTGVAKEFKPFRPRTIDGNDPFLIERYILTEIQSTVWIYMVRADYFQKCRILETYYTQTTGSHEPGYIIPLLAYGGKLKFFPLPLYHFNVGDEGHSRHTRYAQAQTFYNEYEKLCDIAIRNLPDAVADGKRKEKLLAISSLSKAIHLHDRAVSLQVDSQTLDDVFQSILTAAGFILAKTPPAINISNHWYLIRALINSLIPHHFENLDLRGNRIIGYGALGKSAARLLPYLKGTSLEPTLLWDVKGNGIDVRKPDLASLHRNDLLLIFPKGKIEEELREHLKNSPSRILYNEDIVNFIASILYSHFFDSFDL